MGYVSWFQKKFIFLPFVLVATLVVFLYKSCNNDGESSLLFQTKEELLLLKEQLSKLEKLHKHKHLSEDKRTDVETLPIIYFITPTYTRYTQQADLIRLSNTLKHVPNLHWILVEDSTSATKLVSNLLKWSGLTFTHLYVHTQRQLVRQKNEERWKRHRGVDQRNHALSWIRKNINGESEGVVYFGDDDNTYHLELFTQMRSTNKVSMWPVALVGGLRFEGPLCSKGKVRKFFTAWMPQRQFPIDMAAFAVNLKLLFHHSSSYINPEVSRGFLETDFLQQLEITVDDVEGKGNDCTQILVWHTQTAEPNMKEEAKLKQLGLPGSDVNVII